MSATTDPSAATGSDSTNPAPATKAYDVAARRAEFPILARKVWDKPLVYLDNAATTHKPQVVIDAISGFYAHENSNVHRGVHRLSQEATESFEGAREIIRGFLNAAESREVIFVRGTTEGINLVAQTYGRTHLKPGRAVLLTTMEHHSNIVPWQLICEQTGADLRVAPILDDGSLDREGFDRLLTDEVDIVAIGHVSNALGTVNPIQSLAKAAHAVGAIIVVDGAQAVPHEPVDVQALDVDFYALSGHKAYGPTGIGALYGKAALLEALPPYQGGGDMIRSVTFERTIYNDLPYRFEAGTPNIAGAVGLGAACAYLDGVGRPAIAAYEADLLAYGTERLAAVPGVKLVGTAPGKAAVLSFLMERAHPHDIGTILDRQGVAIRTGHHCAQPVMERFGIPATARASLGLYNTREEIDALIDALAQVRELLG